MMTQNEIVNYIDKALLNYAAEINWDFHPASDRFWNFEGAIHYSLIRASNARKILEIGTEYGTATRFLAEAATKNNGHVITVELGQSQSDKAKENLAGYPVTFYVRDCKEFPLDDRYDFCFFDANHDADAFYWYIKNLMPRIRGWWASHDIDVNQDIIDGGVKMYNGGDIEATAFKKTFIGKYISARNMFGHTTYRPPRPEVSSGHENGSAYMYLDDSFIADMIPKVVDKTP